MYVHPWWKIRKFCRERRKKGDEKKEAGIIFHAAQETFDFLEVSRLLSRRLKHWCVGSGRVRSNVAVSPTHIQLLPVVRCFTAGGFRGGYLPWHWHKPFYTSFQWPQGQVGIMSTRLRKASETSRSLGCEEMISRIFITEMCRCESWNYCHYIDAMRKLCLRETSKDVTTVTTEQRQILDQVHLSVTYSWNKSVSFNVTTPIVG